EFVPQERVMNLIESARELGVPVKINSVVHGGSHAQPPATFGTEGFRSVLTASGRGRAVAEADPLDGGPTTAACPVNGPFITTAGEAVACCGPLCSSERRTPVHLGHVGQEGLSAVKERFDRSTVVLAMRLMGPAELARLVAEHGGPDVVGRGTFASGSACEVCTRLMEDPEAAAASVALTNEAGLRRRLRTLELLTGLGTSMVYEP
ncbi:MAG: hypothetical protein K6T75_09360, partial [Acetobacteraceae bacterium]|nr:hypothetical protein [Acetobacteraceae bacterium]